MPKAWEYTGNGGRKPDAGKGLGFRQCPVKPEMGSERRKWDKEGVNRLREALGLQRPQQQ